MVRVNVVSNESEVKRREQRARIGPMHPRPLLLGATLAATLHACARLTCTPATITVAAKDERPRFSGEPRGLTTDELGRVKEQRREVIVSEYWVRDGEGHWHRVSETEWRAVAPGQTMTVCR